jgi:PAS domain S-box-containing protein
MDGITRLNSAFEEIAAADREEVIGRNVEDLFAPGFADTLHQVLGEPGWRLVHTRNIYKLHTATAAGRLLVLNIAIAPLWADSQEQTGASGGVRGCH